MTVNNETELLRAVAFTAYVEFGHGSSKLLLFTLISLAHRGEYGHLEAWPTLADLRELVGSSERSIRRSIRQLTERGFLEVLRDPSRSNLYRLQEDKIIKTASHKPTEGTPAHAKPEEDEADNIQSPRLHGGVVVPIRPGKGRIDIDTRASQSEA